jgi:hypothetical protein
VTSQKLGWIAKSHKHISRDAIMDNNTSKIPGTNNEACWHVELWGHKVKHVAQLLHKHLSRLRWNFEKTHDREKRSYKVNQLYKRQVKSLSVVNRNRESDCCWVKFLRWCRVGPSARTEIVNLVLNNVEK